MLLYLRYSLLTCKVLHCDLPWGGEVSFWLLQRGTPVSRELQLTLTRRYQADSGSGTGWLSALRSQVPRLAPPYYASFCEVSTSVPGKDGGELVLR